MKRLLFVLILLIPMGLSAQETFKDLYYKYSKEGFTTVVISGDMVRNMMQLNSSKDPELLALINGIAYIRLVVADKPDYMFAADMKNVIDDDSYRLMASLSENGEQIVIKYKNKQPQYRNDPYPQSEFMIMQVGKKDNFIINITGRLNIRYINKLSNIRVVKMDSLEKFGKGIEVSNQ